MADQQVEFWKQESRNLVHLAESLLASRNLPVYIAEDIVQEAWMRFRKTISRKPSEAWKPELRATISHLVLDHGRRKGNQQGHKVEIDGFASDAILIPVRSHELEVIDEVFAQQVAVKLSRRLSTKQHAALQLRVIHAMTAEEIGTHLGVSARQARRYIVTGMAVVRDLLS